MFRKVRLFECIQPLIIVALLICGGKIDAISPMAEIRSTTSDFEYNLSLGPTIESRNSSEARTRFLYGNSAPILSMLDIQSAIERVILSTNKTYDTHAHPRAAEVIYVEGGNITVILALDELGLEKIVKNSALRESVVVIPQGTFHNITCVSDDDCVYLSYYNSAYPGRV